MSTNLHAGHRERLRQKYLHDRHGLATHEVLEMILFHAQPRKNTNEIAHELIRKFGTLERIFDAPAEDLMQIKGVSTAIASFLRAFPQLFESYYNLKDKPLAKLNDRESLKDYMMPKFDGETNEVLYVAYLDKNYNALCCEILERGDAYHVQSTLNNLVESIKLKGAKSIALAHNHPCSSCMPSNKDIEATIKIKATLTMLDYKLIDHLIFGDDGYCSIMELAEKKAQEEQKLNPDTDFIKVLQYKNNKK